jgi:serine/threonine protein kinase
MRECSHHPQIAVQLASAVHYMHSQDCVHRDIKPENMCIDDDESIRLIDFGLSQELRDCHTRKVGTPVCPDSVGAQVDGFFAGKNAVECLPCHQGLAQRNGSNGKHFCTPQVYMAPELLDKRKERCTCGMDLKASDVWSFAVTLFCMLTGVLLLFTGLARTNRGKAFASFRPLVCIQPIAFLCRHIALGDPRHVGLIAALCPRMFSAGRFPWRMAEPESTEFRAFIKAGGPRHDLGPHWAIVPPAFMPLFENCFRMDPKQRWSMGQVHQFLATLVL